MHHKMLIGILLCTFNSAILTGCVTAPPTERCASWTMAKPKPLGDVKEGDDIIQKYAGLRKDSSKEKSQIRGLQACVVAMVGE